MRVGFYTYYLDKYRRSAPFHLKRLEPVKVEGVAHQVKLKISLGVAKF